VAVKEIENFKKVSGVCLEAKSCMVEFQMGLVSEFVMLPVANRFFLCFCSRGCFTSDRESRNPVGMRCEGGKN